MDWARILAYVTGTVEQVLLARNGYLAAENRVMKAHPKRLPALANGARGANSARRTLSAPSAFKWALVLWRRPSPI